MSLTANEYMQNELDDKNIDNESKVTNEDKWIHPRKCAPINYFSKTCKNKEEWKENNNKFSLFVVDDENE